MVAVRTCGYNGCGNPVREGESRCYLHKNVEVHASNPLKSSTAADTALIREQWESLRALTAIVNRKAPGSLTMNETQAGFLVASSKLDMNTAKMVADAGEIITRRRPELNTPAFVAQNLTNLIQEFETDLNESGVDSSRLSKLQMWDATRLIGNGRIEHSAEVGHVVLVVDRGQETESTLDVGISLFAPVADPNRPVAEQYDTKFSPFGYAPLVSTIDTYKQKEYLWFENFRYIES